jgi:TrmH family RNA methyltransferase
VLVAEGVHLVREALRSGADVECVIASSRLDKSPEGRGLRGEIAHRGIESLEADDSLLDALQDARSAQPVLAVVRVRERSLDEVVDGGPGVVPLVVVADRVQDPGNLGAILRTADAAGATGLVACGGSVDLRHPRLVRATMGSIFRVKTAVAERDDAIRALGAHGLRTVASDPREGRAYFELDLGGPLALLLGGEGAGLDPAWLARADERARIPMRDGVDSLSVGAAAAVLLFESARQRSKR